MKNVTTVQVSREDKNLLDEICSKKDRKIKQQVSRLIRHEYFRLVSVGELPGPGDHTPVPVVEVENGGPIIGEDGQALVGVLVVLALVLIVLIVLAVLIPPVYWFVMSWVGG